MVTIFTPTFNRAYSLERLYKSLIAQTNLDFEWLILDDGSKDKTLEVVNLFKSASPFKIRYVYQTNGGKHRAINKGLALALGNIFFIVDSDDILCSNSIEIISEGFRKIAKSEGLAGIIGRKANFASQVIGSAIKYEPLITNIVDLRYSLKIKGDLAEVFYTDVLRRFVFPEFPEESFCPEALIWNRISQEYRFLYIDEIIYNCEYQSDGLTSRIVEIRRNSPLASSLYYSELIKLDIGLLDKIKASVNFWRFAVLVPKFNLLEMHRGYRMGIYLIFYPLGLIFSIIDKRSL